MIRIFRFLIMLITIPLDYIGWNLLFSRAHGKVTLKKVIIDNRKMLVGKKLDG